MRLYSVFMKHTFRKAVQGVLFLGTYDSVDDAIECINREAKYKEELLKNLYVDDQDLVDLSNDENGLAEVTIAQEEVYKFFYDDCELNKKTYVDITEY